MRFNQRALYAAAARCDGTADREGILFIKENTGLFRRPSSGHFRFDHLSVVQIVLCLRRLCTALVQTQGKYLILFEVIRQGVTGFLMRRLSFPIHSSILSSSDVSSCWCFSVGEMPRSHGSVQ